MQSNLLPKSIYRNSGKFFLIIKAKPGSKKEGITGKFNIYYYLNLWQIRNFR
jgi:hypothetical protein